MPPLLFWNLISPGCILLHFLKDPLLKKYSCCWMETDTFIRFSGVWSIINSKIWIIKDKLKIKWGKPSSKYFTKCYKIWEVTWEMIRKFKVFLSNFGIFSIAKVDFIIQLLDIFNIKKAALPSFCWIVLTNFWISTTKIKQINPASTGYFYPTFGYLQTNSRFFAIPRVLLDFLTNLWISKAKIK